MQVKPPEHPGWLNEEQAQIIEETRKQALNKKTSNQQGNRHLFPLFPAIFSYAAHAGTLFPVIL